MNDITISGYIKLVQAKQAIKKFANSEKGVTAIEYAVVVAGVTAVVMVVFGSTGPVSEMLTGTFETLKERVEGLIESPE
ncbi:Flp family type IVb pilin [Limnobaculum xujianqingii]|uniref:Flp family type IVb pilin n=1 Tax=Limnobaculum xujianqingii TaxID=2738837 RepID=UPI00112D6AAE|nr:Flp family type IVb pilin [Limnobaculum xujianqingii]